MSIDTLRPGVVLRTLSFQNPRLNGHRCPVIELDSGNPGPRLCVMAGVHINEASSISAALSIADAIDVTAMRGSISIIPVISTHNIFKFTTVSPPTKERDLHWSYPGDPEGSFNECLAHAILNDWAKDADVLIDMHGGDIDERMVRYVVIQHSGNEAFDAQAEGIAACFDTPLVVALEASLMEEQGRCCTALAHQGRVAIVTEAGDFGMADPDSTAWHLQGVRQVAIRMGIIDGAVSLRTNQLYLDRYQWINAPVEGIVDKYFKPGDWVESGTKIGAMFDQFGREIEPILAPGSGYVMMQKTPQFATGGFWIGSVATPRRSLSGPPDVTF